MEIIEKIIDLKPYESKLISMYFGNGKTAFFDIETTGLSPKNNKLILSGILEISENKSIATQYFASSMGDEKDLVEATANKLSNYDIIVTYNGKSFDIPFLQERMKKYKVKDTLNQIGHLDLYRVIKGYSNIKDIIGSLRQKNIEVFMGLNTNRDDEITGAESVKQYNEYLTTHSSDLKETILLHNSDDIIQLSRILPIVSQTDFHKAMFECGYPYKDFLVTETKISKGILSFSAVSKYPYNDYVMFPTDNMPYKIQYSSQSQTLNVDILGTEVHKGIHAIDAIKILGTDDFSIIKRYPSFESGYLVISNTAQDFSASNAFIMSFINMLKKELLTKKEHTNTTDSHTPDRKKDFSDNGQLSFF